MKTHKMALITAGAAVLGLGVEYEISAPGSWIAVTFGIALIAAVVWRITTPHDTPPLSGGNLASRDRD